MRDADELKSTLARIDGHAYPAYKELRGSYDLGDLELHVDHVQGDPFAAPSKVRVRLPAAVARLPADWIDDRVRRTALADFLARRAREAIERARGARRGSGKSGLVAIDAGAQQVLERTAVRLAPGFAEARLEVGLPAAGRRILGGEAQRILLDEVPLVARRALRWEAVPREDARRLVECVENHARIREQLSGLGLVAFLADGAVLARASGASDRPLADEPVPLRAPPGLRVDVEVPNAVQTPEGESRFLRGLGVPRGVTLVVGGGYHGKSTLLHALERGVYPHVPGDGREQVATTADAVKIRAEDGRRVAGVDIHAFIADLPRGRSTERFESEDASGSTSQAANIVEAIEIGARCLLIDEDTSATNFLVRDARMQALVHEDAEPITPLLDRVRDLHERLGVSTVLVMGGCGDYFDVADTVIGMREYMPADRTAEARRIAVRHPTRRAAARRRPLAEVVDRVPDATSLDPSRGRRPVRIGARERERIDYGTETIDLRAVEQIVDPSQTRAIGLALELARRELMDGDATVREVLDALEARIDADGIDVLGPARRGDAHPGNLARPRRHEIGAALNRLRTARFRQRRG